MSRDKSVRGQTEKDLNGLPVILSYYLVPSAEGNEMNPLVPTTVWVEEVFCNSFEISEFIKDRTIERWEAEIGVDYDED